MPSFRNLFRRKVRRDIADNVEKEEPKSSTARSEYRDRNVQPQLPASRPRALTLPLPPTLAVDSIKQQTSDQTESLLMRLPIEIRLTIYEAVLGYHTVHVSLDFGASKYHRLEKDEVPEWRWWHTICSGHQQDEYQKWCGFCPGGQTGRCNGQPRKHSEIMSKSSVDIRLLLTCRKIYSEAINVLYRTTNFNLASHQLLRSLPSLILPQRFATITSIQQACIFLDLGLKDPPESTLIHYREMWTMLASMPSLLHLKIAIFAYECPSPIPDGLDKRWLGPIQLLKRKGLKTFEVWIPKFYIEHFASTKTRIIS